MNKIKPATNEIYHIYNRGVEKRKIFLDDSDHFRFIHDLFEFNDEEAALNVGYFIARHPLQSIEGNLQYIKPKRGVHEPRKFIVEILAFCLMPNHFHLLLSQKMEGGITKFMLKLGTGYTNYFNEKYERVGSLFQGTYKLAHVKTDAHFIHLPYYIHLNPLDIKMPEWREGGLKDPKKALDYLENYRWSSFLDYIGKKNFPSVTQREFLLKFFNGPMAYKKGMARWIKEANLESISHLTLEPIY